MVGFLYMSALFGVMSYVYAVIQRPLGPMMDRPKSLNSIRALPPRLPSPAKFPSEQHLCA